LPFLFGLVGKLVKCTLPWIVLRRGFFWIPLIPGLLKPALPFFVSYPPAPPAVTSKAYRFRPRGVFAKAFMVFAFETFAFRLAFSCTFSFPFTFVAFAFAFAFAFVTFTLSFVPTGLRGPPSSRRTLRVRLDFVGDGGNKGIGALALSQFLSSVTISLDLFSNLLWAIKARGV
jgi:hypothetical protein